MNFRRNSFHDRLDEAIDRMLAGKGGDSAPTIAESDELHALLGVAAAIPHETYQPPSARLEANFARIRTALRDGVNAPESAPKWWQRRLTFATMTLPAGVFAFALFSAGGAAAATVAVTTDLPARVAQSIEEVAPSWTHGLIPDGGDEQLAHATEAPGGVNTRASTHTASVDTTPTSVAPPVVVVTEVPSQGGATTAPPPTTDDFTAQGIIRNIRGNTFELVGAEATFKAQVDSNTVVSGAIEEGASAQIQGRLVGNDRLHASVVTITAGPPQQGLPPQQTQPPPGQADRTHTPPGQADKTKTPPGQANKTKTPPGHGNGGGNGNGNANGNGNGNANN